MRLSYVSNESLTSPLETNRLLLAKASRAPLCLDEARPGLESYRGSALTGEGRCVRVGEAGVTAPKVVHKVDPQITRGTREALGREKSVVVIVGATITKSGCVKNMRLVKQSAIGNFNREAVLALSQWTFEPGTLNGEPIDALFNLSINYKVP